MIAPLNNTSSYSNSNLSKEVFHEINPDPETLLTSPHQTHKSSTTNTPQTSLPVTPVPKIYLPDPDENEIRRASLVFDTGVSSNANSRFLDLVQEYEDCRSLVEKLPSLQVEVQDGHFVYAPAHGEVILNLVDEHGDPFRV
jgi:hypothetical protein